MRVCFLQILFISLFMTACGRSTDRCDHRFLLLWPGADGHYSFQEIQISSLPSPLEVRGPNAEVYYEAPLDDLGFHGPAAHPHLTKSGHLCVPQDAASSLVLSAYAQYERLNGWERALGVVDQISWPRRVGLKIHISGPSGGAENNAHYYGSMDTTIFVPYTQEDLPLSLNQGIVAHELFHAHFQSQVIAPLSQKLELQGDDLTRLDAHTVLGLNNFTLRGWNEGLADYFAAVYTKQPDFFRESTPNVKRRNLAGPLRMFKSAFNAGESSLGAYSVGTNLARLLYQLGHSGAETPERLLIRVMGRLHLMASELAPVYDKQAIDEERIVALLLSGLPLNATACRELKTALSPYIMQKEFARCGAL